MHRITDIEALDNFVLSCRFSDGDFKLVDLKPVLTKEAFIPLQDPTNFTRAVNKSYFVEWLGLDIDLSADTLWHWGIAKQT